MTSSFDELVQLITPPPGGPKLDWGQVESVLGHPLPADFTAIVERYGSGRFGDEVSVWLPGGYEGEDLIVESPAAVELLASFRETFRDDHEVWVEPNGAASPIDADAAFIPWGGGASGAYGFWHRTSDNPDQWPVFWCDFRSNLRLYHRGGIAAFIRDLVTGHYPAEAASEDITSGPIFVPLSFEYETGPYMAGS